VTRSADEVAEVLELVGAGLNDCDISRRTEIPRSTIRGWRSGRIPGARTRRRAGCCLICDGYRFPVPEVSEHAYAYLLGLYLGDGHIAAAPKGVYRLRIHLDRSYPVIVAECAAAIGILVPDNKVSVVPSPDSHMDVPGAYWRHWPCVFPQHGPGRKHHRRIVLEEWQRAILDRYPWRFLRGLIHSDGYRGLNTIRHPKKTYAYPRYQFSNRSDDIRGLFCEYCDLVGVEWRRMNRWTISVARRDSVALMDRSIGPKR
jgi:hypothetical protein